MIIYYIIIDCLVFLSTNVGTGAAKLKTRPMGVEMPASAHSRAFIFMGGAVRLALGSPPIGPK